MKTMAELSLRRPVSAGAAVAVHFAFANLHRLAGRDAELLEAIVQDIADRLGHVKRAAVARKLVLLPAELRIDELAG